MGAIPHSPTTGEVVELPAIVDEYILILEAVDECRDELRRLESILADAYRQIMDAIPDLGTLRGTSGDSVVRVPGKPGRRSIDHGVAMEHQEALLTAGLGERVTEYKPPTLAEVTAAIAELAAAGVPVESLIRQATRAPSTLKVVRANGKV